LRIATPPQASKGESYVSLAKDRLSENGRPVYCPSSVYRLQMNAGFTFRDAKSILPFLHDLGVEAVYLSPIFKAVPGSSHGYDVTDPTVLNPELGGQAEFDAFCDKIRELKMGIILDTVPNHMGIAGSHNALWLDVLENGPSSVHAGFFDIDWKPVKAELENKILIPILGDLYGLVLDRREIQLELDDSKGAFYVRYFDNRFPVDPQTYPTILEFRIDELKGHLNEDEAVVSDYLSVITAFKNLPSRTETNIEKIRERMREKEVAKKRFAEILSRSRLIKEFVESRLVIYNGVKNDSASFDLLDRFLDEQVYRMAFWRTAAEEINYRRFFDINELAAIRMEDERVFEHCHRLIFQWIAEGKVHGLRIDHPDGLYDPPVYFRRLQEKFVAHRKECRKISSREIRSSAKPLYVVAEKILDRKEFLPENWSVHGTVGYDFLNVLNGVFVDQNHQKDFSELYETFIGHTIDFDQLLYDKKKLFALVHMASEINTLGHRLDLISEKDRHYRDFTRNNLTLAIREVIACFPVYRTYLSPSDESVSERDERYINIAVEKAKAKTPALNPAVYDFLREVLLLKFDVGVTAEAKKIYRDFVLRFQQLTGPIMAKGMEDTSFYVYNRFVSLNEVGGDPFRFGHSKEEFHQFNKLKSERWPYGMLCTSTHDAKRSEDVRMRLNVLSEIPDDWRSVLTRWALINEKHKTLIRGVAEPRRNTEYFIYQAILGAWPESGTNAQSGPAFTDRIWEYVLKSIREAKTHTNWIHPKREYEESVRKFVYGILSPGKGNRFLKNFRLFHEKVSWFAKLNSLSALVLKIGSPGVVDVYQGTEFWNLFLTDPDNRRPVDFEERKGALQKIVKGSKIRGLDGDMASLLTGKKSERVKMQVLALGLRLRRSEPGIFLEGDYVPLRVEGERERNVVAFLRRERDRFVIFAAGRFFTEISGGPGQLPVGPAVWKTTRILLPAGLACRETLKDILTDREVPVGVDGELKSLRVSDVFGRLNAGILMNGS
jgi:(1->4)-alpha-D-glucan 1-alpha-D-glucosylmutase